MPNPPQARMKNLVVQEFANEILIYDFKTNKAYCLNQTSATIWQLCDGTKSVAEISQILTNKLQQPITEDLIWLALDGFKNDNLLEQSEQFAINFNGLSRRQVIKKVGLATIAALPIITGVTAPKAVEASSTCPTTSCGNSVICPPAACPNCRGTGNCGGAGSPCTNIGSSCTSMGTCSSIGFGIYNCSVPGGACAGPGTCTAFGICIGAGTCQP